ncbi:MAG: aerolysin family beta-barrel pore-forming toxin [Synergistaceae bacterium]|nr:aerolysin family beta-barrel pore-forming toxin [Synergistaceae bacterium]
MKSKIVSGLLVLALSAGILLTGFAGTALAAEKTPPAIADTYTIDGVTYYNVNSANFDSPKKFYEDVFNAKHSSLGGRSLAELWMLTAVGVGRGLPQVTGMMGMSSTLDSAKEVALKGQYGSGAIDDPLKAGYYQYSYTAPQWDNSGYVETTLHTAKLLSHSLIIRVRFSDFGVGVILPGNAGHYVSTSIENDDVKGEQAASAKNDSNNTVTIGQNISKTETASLTSTINHSFSYGFKEGVKVGAGFDVGIFKVAGEISFEANQTISDGWSNSETKSKSKTVNNSISVTLPPYTTAMLKQGESDATVTTTYNCPVMLSYKVEIYCQSGLIATGVAFSSEARDDLRQRALVDVDYDPQNINWRTALADSDVKDAVEKIASHVPMSGTGAKMVYKNRTTYNEVSGIAALYPLNAVDLEKPNISFVDSNKVANMEVGNYSYTEYLPVAGYNDRGAAYYGFNKSYGEWRVVDAAGNELTGDSAPVVLEKTSSGYTKFTAMRPGKCFLRYFISENAYPSGLGSNSYTKNTDLARIAQLEINVAGEKVEYQIDGEYNGFVNAVPESIEADGKLEVHAYNADDIEVDAPYYWEKREKKGISLTADGTVSFDKPGTYRVRVRNKADKTLYSKWKEITAEVTGDDYVKQDIPIVRSELADGDTQFVITGRFIGGVNVSESIEGEGKFQVETHTSSGQETAVKYTWEAQEAGNGITIDENGRVSFDNPGVYHVRIRSGEVTSEWLEVWVNEKAQARLLRAPSAPGNYSDGAEQALLNDDARYDGGVRMFYGLGSDDVTLPTEYSTGIPEVSAAGTYYVWCKVQGDENHIDSSPVCVISTIAGEQKQDDQQQDNQQQDDQQQNEQKQDESNTDDSQQDDQQQDEQQQDEQQQDDSDYTFHKSSGGCDGGFSVLGLGLMLSAVIMKRRTH